MPVFLSHFSNKLDRKGRVSVPAPFRATLAAETYQGVVLFRAPNHPCLEGFNFSAMEEISQRLDQLDLFSGQQDDLATTLFGEAVPCPFDSEGRIGIPPDLLRHAGIEESVTFVGMGRKFQVWDSAKFTKRRETARENIAQKGITLPMLRQKGEGQA